MPIEITIPSPGESITEVVLGPWRKASGEWVERDETLVEIESDKVTMELPAPQTGVLAITADEGAEMHVGDVIGTIDPDAERPAGAAAGAAKGAGAAAAASAPASARQVASRTAGDGDGAAAVEVATATAAAAGGAAAAAPPGSGRATPLARKIAADRGVAVDDIRGTGPSGRVTRSDVLAAAAEPPRAEPAASGLPEVAQRVIDVPEQGAGRVVRRERMSRLRQRVAERLVAAQHQAAMLTTFNEADMSEVLRLRAEHKESFLERHGVGLGFMGFFVKACVSALRAFPAINAYVVGDEIEYHDFVDVSVAVGTPKGLVVPVLRNAETLSFAEIEAGIRDLATRARDGKLTIDEMTGGTFTVSNGGVYGSLMSTPILNPPQSGILGMHKIMPRAVEDPAHPGQLTLRPMMYLALSYDHRIVDGEQAVRFLVHVKEHVERPERLLIGV